MLPPKAYQAAKTLVLSVGVILIGVVLTFVIGYVMASPTFGWTGAILTPAVYFVVVNLFQRLGFTCLDLRSDSR